MMLTKLGLIVAMAATVGQGAAPEKVWQEGMLLNPENNAYFKSVAKTEESEEVPHTIGNTAAKSAISGMMDRFVIDSSDGSYLVERTRFSTSPPPKVFITMTVKFYIEKKKLVMLDREGHPLETKIVKQAPKVNLAVGQ